MGIVNVFQALGSALINHTKDKAQMQSLRKDDVITILKQNIEMHKANFETLNVMSAQEMNSWMLKVTQALNDTPSKSRVIYDRYNKGLYSSACG